MKDIFKKFKNYKTIKTPIKGKNYTLWIADNDKKRGLGLSGIDELPRNFGMIFVYNRDVNTPFTMQNTKIPLKIIFLDSNFDIIEVFNCKPFQKKSVQPKKKFRYVVEI